MCTQIWHLSHCAAWWLLATALLHILHGNLITIINCCKRLESVEKGKEEQQKIKKEEEEKKKNVLKVFNKDFIYHLNLGINICKRGLKQNVKCTCTVFFYQICEFV